MGDAGRAWLRRSLAAGKSLSQAVLDSGRVARAECFVILPESLVRHGEVRLDVGGVITTSEADRMLGPVLRGLVRSEDDLMVIEDDLRKRNDRFVEEQPLRRLYEGDDVFWLVNPSEGSEEQLVRFVRTAASGFPSNGFLLNSEASVDQSIPGLSTAVYGGFVAAFDAESFLFWRTAS